jgi:predicted RNA-binding Zn-ribbon protein involved in translation (DUF1610 family)
MTLKSITLLALVSMAILAVLYYLFRKVRFKKDCPVCGNMYTDRIARPKWLRIVPSKAYQCNACRHRYYYIGRKYESSTPTLTM